MFWYASGTVLIKSLLALATVVVAAVAGVFLIALYSNVAETGGTTLEIVTRSFTHGEWGWFTPQAALGVALIAGSGLGFVAFAAYVVRRARTSRRMRAGFEVEEL